MSSSPALETSTPSSPVVHHQTFVYNQQYQHHSATRDERTPRDQSTGKSSSVPRQANPLQVWLPASNTPAPYPSTPPSHSFSGGPPLSHSEAITPPPRSPAALSWSGGNTNTSHVNLGQTHTDGSPRAHHSHHPDGTSSDKSSETAVVVTTEGTVTSTLGVGPPRLSRKESYKAQRQHYRKEKKRAASALLSSLEDPAVVILADWLKVRGSLKSWTKLWCVLKPGLLVLYKNPKAKSSHWVGTVLVSSCHAIERPSKKDGFCFKLYHPLDQNIWAPRGPHNETIGAVVQPLPTSHLIFRAPSQAAGKCWMDGLELALRNTANHSTVGNQSWIAPSVLLATPGSAPGAMADHASGSPHPMASHETQWSREDLEKHFNDHDLEGADLSETDTDGSGEGGHRGRRASAPPAALTAVGALINPDVSAQAVTLRERWDATYVEETSDDVGQAGEQVEELAEENKSLLWFLIKQVRPGMDLSKVVLPTFILEPRSFLDRLADNYYHADVLSRAAKMDDEYDRFKTVLSWYLSGLYKKPRGLKKPYNPVLGEVYRCCWPHADTGSATYYIAEQVSHHPPVSAFYVSNRKDGFVIEGAILAKSKFYGNSTSAILEGAGKLTLTSRQESYIMTTPYAHCKGIVMGTLSMELGGKVIVECQSTGYKADIEFKLKSYFGGSDQINSVSGRIKKNKEVIATLDGYWDGKIDLKEKKSGKEIVLVDVNILKRHRLKRHVMSVQHQEMNESQKLWQHVTRAIADEDQVAATEEKTKIEEAQRKRARDMKDEIYEPRLFRRASPIFTQANTPLQTVQSTDGQHWEYRYPNLRPWDSSSDVLEYERDFIMHTLSRSDSADSPAIVERRTRTGRPHINRHNSITDTDTSREDIARNAKVPAAMNQTLRQLESSMLEITEQISDVRRTLTRLEQNQNGRRRNPANAGRVLTDGAVSEMFYAIVIALLVQSLLSWIYNKF